MKTYCLGILAAFALAASAHAAPFQFNSLTTYSQESQGSTIGMLTHIQGNLPIAVDLANLNEATSFRINANTMWGGNVFQVLLGQDPTYKPGATKATINTPAGNVQLSWTATNLAFSGVLADNALVMAFPGFSVTPIPLGTNGPFVSTNAFISIHFQYSDFTHIATITGTNKLVAVLSTFPGFPGIPFYVTVNTGKFSMTTDLVPPTIKINSPAQNAVVTSDNVNVDLTISDNVALGTGPLSLGGGATLSYSANGGPFYGDADTNPGDTTNRHSINLNGLIVPGTNTVTFIAVDSSGNLATNKLVLFFSQRSPITLVTNGVGGITGITNGQMLEIGRNYIITAKPGVGKLLSAWQDGDGNVLGRTNKLVFRMTDGLTLTASFADTPFPSFQGTYIGYFLPTFTPNASQFGSLKIILGASGSFSGTLNSGAGSQTFAGQFLYGSNGVQDAYVIVTSKFSTNGLYLSLTTDPGDSNFGLIQGSVGFAANGVKIAHSAYIASADISAARQTNASVISGPAVFHYRINSTTNDGVFPQGFGFGTLAVKADGTITGSLSLADGDAPPTVFSTHLVYHNGYAVVFVPLYKNGGGFLMTLNLGSVPTDGSDFYVNTATWVKSPGKPFYPNGFATGNDIYIARYATLPSGVFGGDFNAAIDADVSVSVAVNVAANGTIAEIGNSAHVKGTVTVAGSVTGSFLDTSITRTFKGLVVPTQSDSYVAYGFFVRSNKTGFITFELSH